VSVSKVPLRTLFGKHKAIIAGVHLLPLPGSPLYDRSSGMRAILRRAREDVMILTEHGVDALLFANEADTPYLQELGPESVAAFTDAVGEAARDSPLPFGVNALLDPVAGVAIAHATGGSFVRGYFAGVYASDVGLMSTRGPQALRLRANLNAEHIQLFHNLVCAFGVPFVPRPLGEEAHSVAVHANVDGFTLSGRAATFSPTRDQFNEVHSASPELPVVVGTGATTENIGSFLEVADGAIVVSSLRRDGSTLNPVDPLRVAAFMDAVRGARSSLDSSGAVADTVSLP
jgi:membrane complex biogenesis BtpA family protein